MDAEYLQSVVEGNGFSFSSKGNNCKRDLVIIVEHELLDERRSWQGGIACVVNPRAILHHKWPSDTELKSWAKNFDAPIMSCDLTNDQLNQLREQFYAAGSAVIPNLTVRAIYDELVLPMRARYMGSSIRAACQTQGSNGSPVLAIVSERISAPQLFEELEHPSDDSRPVSYIRIDQTVRKA